MGTIETAYQPNPAIIEQLNSVGASVEVGAGHVAANGIPLPLFWKLPNLPSNEVRERLNLRDFGYRDPKRNFNVDPFTPDQETASNILYSKELADDPYTSPQTDPMSVVWLPSPSDVPALQVVDTRNEHAQLFIPDALWTPQHYQEVTEVEVRPQLLVVNGLHRFATFWFLNRAVRPLHLEARVQETDYFGAITNMIKATSDKRELTDPRHYIMHKALWSATGPKRLTAANMDFIDAFAVIGEKKRLTEVISELDHSELNKLDRVELTALENELLAWGVRANEACDMDERPDEHSLSAVDKSRTESLVHERTKQWARNRLDAFEPLSVYTDEEIASLSGYILKGRTVDDITPPSSGYASPSEARIISPLDPGIRSKVREKIQESTDRLSKRDLEYYVDRLQAAEGDESRLYLLNLPMHDIREKAKANREADPAALARALDNVRKKFQDYPGQYTDNLIKSVELLLEELGTLGSDEQDDASNEDSIQEPTEGKSDMRAVSLATDTIGRVEAENVPLDELDDMEDAVLALVGTAQAVADELRARREGVGASTASPETQTPASDDTETDDLLSGIDDSEAYDAPEDDWAEETRLGSEPDETDETGGDEPYDPSEDEPEAGGDESEDTEPDTPDDTEIDPEGPKQEDADTNESSKTVPEKPAGDKDIDVPEDPAQRLRWLAENPKSAWGDDDPFPDPDSIGLSDLKVLKRRLNSPNFRSEDPFSREIVADFIEELIEQRN